jgi:hypothetical protein
MVSLVIFEGAINDSTWWQRPHESLGIISQNDILRVRFGCRKPISLLEKLGESSFVTLPQLGGYPSAVFDKR